MAHSVGHKGIQKTLDRLCSNFYIPGHRLLVQNKLGPALRASETRRRRSGWPAYCSTSRCHSKFGLTSCSTSSMGRQRWEGSSSSSPWLIASPRTPTSSRLAIPTPRHWSPAPSSRALCGYMSFPPPSSATGTSALIEVTMNAYLCITTYFFRAHSWLFDRVRTLSFETASSSTLKRGVTLLAPFCSLAP